ncbi:hypothetical protein FOZ62_004401 [Perkinsus olseni]|uniref:Uncharacterized protein n=1 Tax=Perkinsus olseni TaxID=32597 RepID=A0A7J6R175_PEROL|nr:hypothetical protein FOZ62_004401 [Perkinsus olseni]
MPQTGSRNPVQPSPSRDVDTDSRLAAPHSARTQDGGIHGYGGGVRGHAYRRRWEYSDGGTSNSVKEHHRYSQRRGNFAGRSGVGSTRKGKDFERGEYPQVDNCCSSGGSPASDWAGGGSGKVNRGRKENARDRGNTRSKTYAPSIGCSLGNSESSQVSEKEWGEGALILTLESPPSAVLSGRESEDSKLATTPEHTPAPQLAVASSPGNAPLLPQCELPHLSSSLVKPTQPVDDEPEVLGAALEALTIGSSMGHSADALPSPGDGRVQRQVPGYECCTGSDEGAKARAEITSDGPRLRVDKEAAMRIICHYTGLRRPRKPTST